MLQEETRWQVQHPDKSDTLKMNRAMINLKEIEVEKWAIAALSAITMAVATAEECVSLLEEGYGHLVCGQ